MLLKSNHRCMIECIISLLRDYYNRRWESYRAVDVCVRRFWQNSNIKTLVLCIDRYTLRIVVCMLGADSLYHFLSWSVPGLLSCYVHNCLLYCVLGLKTLSFCFRNNGVVIDASLVQLMHQVWSFTCHECGLWTLIGSALVTCAIAVALRYDDMA